MDEERGRVVNLKYIPFPERRARERDGSLVYIGRPSMWGNPFMIGVDGGRDQVIAKFEHWARNSQDLRARVLRASVRTLRGKDLACYCAPLACHGDVLLAMAWED